ncbi:MAG: hypothetical protein IH591_15475 [Bacteroidales bacterium]|nr:hypothetical protein [Bacteroidales bacterium]
MKSLILIAAALMSTLCLSAQNVDGTSEKLIDAFVKSNVSIEKETVDQTALAPVFAGRFFKVTVGFIETGTGASSCGTFNFMNINDNEVSMIEPIHMDLECPVLLSLIRSDFRLKDENAAKLFEASLNILYPLDEDEAGDVKHMKKDSQWIFLREKFFDDYIAFVVTTAPDGKVTKIDLVLGYQVTQ